MLHMPVQVHRATLRLGNDPVARLVPATGAVDHAHRQQHHRYLDEYADHRGERRTRLKTEQRNGSSHRQLEKLLAPISAEGPATQCGERTARFNR